MKLKWTLLGLIFTIATVLTGCDNPLLVLDPKGPVAETQADIIKMSIWIMSGIVLVVVILYIFMLNKYRASKSSKDYEPPHIEGNPILEAIWIIIPIIIVSILGYFTVVSLNEVESTPVGYEDQEPLIIYASSSDYKWHFSYPEEDIETVNYVNIPVNRPVEFKLYAFGPITSFWIPQLGGQKYAMSDMTNTLHLLADTPGEYWGRNANFNGAGFADMEFEALAMTQSEYDEWVTDVKTSTEELTEDKFNELLTTNVVGRLTFTGTHLDFSPAPKHSHSSSDEDMEDMDMEDMDMEDMEHSN